MIRYEWCYPDPAAVGTWIIGPCAGVGLSEPEVTLDQGFDATTLPDLRNAVLAGAVAAALPDDRAAEVTLAVHKLAANAVRQGGGAGRARMRVVAGQLQCQVSYAGPGSPTAMCAAAVVLMRGRGLSARAWPVAGAERRRSG
jgi:hypothetical protein